MLLTFRENKVVISLQEDFLVPVPEGAFLMNEQQFQGILSLEVGEGEWEGLLLARDLPQKYDVSEQVF